MEKNFKEVLKQRFYENSYRHPKTDWDFIEKSLILMKNF